MRVVVKIGGAALEDKAIRHKCARALVELSRDGHQVAVVHGGGKTLTRTLGQLGKESSFVNGLRVTDADTRDVALMVLAGLVNKGLVATIVAEGGVAMGLCGGDGAIFRARKKRTSGSDLGFVGEISSVDPGWLDAIWMHGGVPVLSSVALGNDGEYYNVNADQVAAACAIAARASALIFLTDVPGVKDADGVVIRWLRSPQMNLLIEDAVVAGGMLPKLEACSHALKNGVGRVRILPVAEVDALPQFFLESLPCGTEVMVA